MRHLVPYRPWIMPRWVSIAHGLTTDVQVAVVVEQIARIWHEGIRRDELPDLWVVVAGVEVLQARGILFLAGKALVGEQCHASAVAAIGAFSTRAQRTGIYAVYTVDAVD